MIMTQEEKDLLLKDIFGRIPYGVKCSYLDIEFNNTTHGNLEGFEYDDDKDIVFIIDGIGIYSEHIKPYLFPVSSMTGEQRKEYVQITAKCGNIASSQLTGMTIQDWFDKNHIDYRGLIPRGLAKDATGLNIY